MPPKPKIIETPFQRNQKYSIALAITVLACEARGEAPYDCQVEAS